jgi:hypothetical protein
MPPPPKINSSGSRRSDIGENRLCMTREVEFFTLDVIGLGDFPVWTNQITDSPGDTGFEVLFAFLADRVVGGPHRLVWIRQERVGKVLILGEFFLICLGIKRCAEYDAIGTLECLCMVAEPATLNRSTRRRSLGVPPKGDPLPRQALEADGLAILIIGREVGRRAANCKHCDSPLRAHLPHHFPWGRRAEVIRPSLAVRGPREDTPRGHATKYK